MKDRIGHLLEDLDVKSENKSNFDYLFVGTFHAFCVRMLRAFGDDRLKAMTNNPAFDSNFSIVDSDDSSKYIKEIMLKKKISIETFKPMVSHTAHTHTPRTDVSFFLARFLYRLPRHTNE